MAYRNKRPASPKGKVFTKFGESEEKALALGKELKIPESKLRRWFKEWKETATPRHTAPSADTKEQPKGKVYHKGDPERHGVIVGQAGPEVTEVRWDDNGRKSFVTNENLCSVTQGSVKTKKKVVTSESSKTPATKSAPQKKKKPATKPVAKKKTRDC